MARLNRWNQKLLQRAITICKSRGRIFAVLAALVGMNTGCSTPQVPYVDPNPPDTAWYAYQRCLEAHPGINTARSNVCDHAGDPNAQGYYYNSSTGAPDTASIGYYPNYDSRGQCISFNSCFGYEDTSSVFARSYRAGARQGQPAPQWSNADLRAAYREHLKTLDEETLRRLTEEWLALAETPSK